MPELCRFFGIIVRMYYDDHNPPHIHVEHSGDEALLDFKGNIIRGEVQSRTAIRLVREWIDMHIDELREDWKLGHQGKEMKKIAPLN